MERKYKYLGYVMILFVPLVFLAFYQTYFKDFPQFPSGINAFDHIHSVIASAWIALLIAQPLLIRYKKMTGTASWAGFLICFFLY